MSHDDDSVHNSMPFLIINLDGHTIQEEIEDSNKQKNIEEPI
jgi:hypothetical protein